MSETLKNVVQSGISPKNVVTKPFSVPYRPLGENNPVFE